MRKLISIITGLAAMLTMSVPALAYESCPERMTSCVDLVYSTDSREAVTIKYQKPEYASDVMAALPETGGEVNEDQSSVDIPHAPDGQNRRESNTPVVDDLLIVSDLDVWLDANPVIMIVMPGAVLLAIAATLFSEARRKR